MEKTFELRDFKHQESRDWSLHSSSTTGMWIYMSWCWQGKEQVCIGKQFFKERCTKHLHSGTVHLISCSWVSTALKDLYPYKPILLLEKRTFFLIFIHELFAIPVFTFTWLFILEICVECRRKDFQAVKSRFIYRSNKLTEISRTLITYHNFYGRY